MPHSFVHMHNNPELLRDADKLVKQLKWETFKAIAYNLGGLIFIIGSVLFLPALSDYEDLGAISFIVGSFVYLIVTGQDMKEVVEARLQMGEKPNFWQRLAFWAATSYLLGTVLFTVGSFLFLSFVGYFIAGAWCFVFGSLLFVLGAVINVLQIVRAKDIVMMQLFNLTAVSFVAGSILFTVASIPYLFDLQKSDEYVVGTFLAWQYIVGSVLFLLGGVFIYWRLVVDKNLLLNKLKPSVRKQVDEQLGA